MGSNEIQIENYTGKATPSKLIPHIGCSYREIEELKEIVELLNDWQYRQAIDKLDENIVNGVQPIESLSLKGEVLALFEYNQQALSVFKTVLQYDPQNVYALSMVIIQSNIVGKSKEDIGKYYSALKMKSIKIYEEIERKMHFIEQHQDMLPLRSMGKELDLICVYGYFLNEDGSMSDRLTKRLLKTCELARKFPEAKILLSGGAVKNCYSEAKEMKKTLIKYGVNKDRIVSLEKAKDTVGNVMEFMNYIETGTYEYICAVTSIDHLPRAWMALYTILKKNKYETTVYSDAYDEKIDSESCKNEHVLNYHTVLRAAGLFTKQEIENLFSS